MSAGEGDPADTAPSVRPDPDRGEPDAVRALRHDLRTPVNHILGYGELLLEEAEAAGRDDLVGPLSRIRSAGKQALLLVSDFFEPAARAARRLDRAWLRQELTGLTDRIIAEGAALRGLAGAGDGDLLPDLDRIEAAARQLRAIVSDGNVGDISVRGQSAFEGAFPARPRPSDLQLTSEGAPATTAGHVLVVDDNPTNRDVLARRLERLGYAAARAGNGREALAAVAATRFDLMLLDIMMPEMDGYEVLRHLQADDGLRDIPVIVISSLDELGSVVRCIELGAADYLTKPFEPVLLRARVGACVEKKRLRDQEVEYLRQVAQVTAAAVSVEGGTYEVGTLTEVAQRPDGLGQLARIFEQMAREVQAREQRLKQQVQELRIEIDRARERQQVAEITGSDYFKELKRTAQQARARGADAARRGRSFD